MRPARLCRSAAARRVPAGGGQPWRGRLRAALTAALCLLTLGHGTAAAAQPRIQVLLSDTTEAYREVDASLRRALEVWAPGRAELETQALAALPGGLKGLLAQEPALIVPVGLRATAVALRDAGPIPVLSLLVPESDYAALWANLKPGAAAPRTRSAIYLDQPLERQLDLLQVLLPNARRVGALAGSQSAAQAERLATLARERGLEAAIMPVPAHGNPIRPLTQLMDGADVLLALPDPDVFRRASLQAILLTTYRSRVPVIGFSQAYVRAGALAAVYSTAGQNGTQAGEWIADLAARGQWTLGEPRNPIYYSISVNPQVAQSLALPAPDEATLLEALQAVETRRP
jgi:ABC-type uncharacterized transport system substrate-binding protein